MRSLKSQLALSVSRRVRFTASRVSESARASIRARIAANSLTVELERGSLEKARTVLVSVMRDDGPRLASWLRYYQLLGVDHFVIIDNGSVDDTVFHLAKLPSVTVYRTTASFKKARFGVDWVNSIMNQRCAGKWVLWADSDEFLCFSGCETRTLTDLVDRLEQESVKSMQCLLLDLYSSSPVHANTVAPGADPLETCRLYDRRGYYLTFDHATLTTWIKGGVRGRLFFRSELQNSPALNKTPLVHWDRRVSFLQVAHRLAPPAMNHQSRARTISGVLLHQKFLASVGTKVANSDHVAQHDAEYLRYENYADASPYEAGLTGTYRSSRDLVADGLMTAIDWMDSGEPSDGAH